jgi:L-seryl-tRNA(Ser) seleniumtransferase
MADFRGIPSIDQLRRRSAVRTLEARFGGPAVVEALRAAAAAVRQSIGGGDISLAAGEAIVARIESIAADRLDEQFHPSLQPVINATGVIVHTNLGRAPLADAAADRVAAVARGYSTIEYDVAQGARGRRDVHAAALLCRLTGAEAAVVVNNNAAATMIVLAALAAGREVIVSRGELVEIGGGFRVPDVLTQSGATLREVGTTNKTRVADYAAAIGERTALILRVHPSNFRIEGFTERPGLDALVDLGRRFGVPVAEDLGSGYLSGRTSPEGRGGLPGDAGPSGRTGLQSSAVALKDEPAIEASVAAGVDVCCFSGDKLLGGPQAGLIVGRREIVERIGRHPLMRALRADKMTYAALEATLAEYAAGRAAVSVPVQRMLAMTAEAIRARAGTLAAQLDGVGGWRAELLPGMSAVGGGSAPGIELPTWLIAIDKEGLTANALESRLRQLRPPIIARIERDRVLLDLRTVSLAQDEQLRGLLLEL